MPSRAARNKNTAGLITGHPREVVGILAGTVAVGCIFMNALFWQKGPHPAPFFAAKPVTHAAVPAPTRVENVALPAAVPLPRPAEAQLVARPRALTVSDIQRELSRRGFYDGAADGVWGAQTDAAARDFAQAVASKLPIEPSEGFLRLLTASKARATRALSPAEPARADPIAQLLAPSPRLLAVQRALAEYGYGQIRPNGQFGPETQDAIKKFEVDHKMPVTGEVSEPLVRALAVMTGHSIE